MSELEMLRAFGDEVQIVELGQLDAARGRLLRAIEAERPSPRRASPSATSPRRRRGLRPVAALAALAAAALIVVLVSGEASRQSALTIRPAILSTPGPLGATAPAHLTGPQILDAAAVVALRGRPVIPRPDQFVYTRNEASGGQTIQQWLSVDGTRPSRIGPHTMFACVHGTLTYGRTPDGTPQTRPCTPTPAFFPTMPTAPRALARYLKRTQGVRLGDVNDVGKTVGELLDSDYLLPAQQAALYRFLARTPGIAVRRSVTDAAGRAGVGVQWTLGGGAAMLIFDPTTLQYLGMTTRGVQGQIAGQALLDTAIVNVAGQRP